MPPAELRGRRKKGNKGEGAAPEPASAAASLPLAEPAASRCASRGGEGKGGPGQPGASA